MIEPDGDGFYAYAPALKGLHMDGNTKQEALDNAIVGIHMYLDSLVRHGEPFPLGPHLSIETVPDLPKVSDAMMVENIQFQWSIQAMSGAN